MKEVGTYIASKCCICGDEIAFHYCLGCSARYCGNCYLNLKTESSEYYDMVHGSWIPTVVTLCKKCGDIVH